MSRIRAYRDLPGDYGACLEVGLGDGELADELIVERQVSELTSVEIDPAVISRYTNKAPARHTIVEDDAETVTLARNYDSCFVDIIDTFDDYAMAQRIVNHLLPNLVRGSRVFVEFMADVEEERSLRQWLATNVGPLSLEHVVVTRRDGSTDRAASRSIAYFVKA